MANILKDGDFSFGTFFIKVNGKDCTVNSLFCQSDKWTLTYYPQYPDSILFPGDQVQMLNKTWTVVSVIDSIMTNTSVPVATVEVSNNNDYAECMKQVKELLCQQMRPLELIEKPATVQTK